MTSPSSLAVRDLVVRFGGLTALDGASLDVPQGRIVGLIGPNGAGKTTLLDAVSGFTSPESGSIRYGEVDLAGRPPWERARHGIARGLQDVRLFPGLTLLDTLRVALHLAVDTDALGDGLALPRNRRAERLMRLRALRRLEEVGLDAHADFPVAALSSGMLRLLELACMGAMQPRLLLLDEPSASLSNAEVAALAPILREMCDRFGTSMLVVEHDLEFLASIADETHLMEEGVIRGSVEPGRRRSQSVARPSPHPRKDAPPLLEVHGLHAGYGDRPVLHGVDFAAHEGEVVAVLGTNGAGKSTLLRAISGLLPASSGTVLWRAREVTALPAHLRAFGGMALVPADRGIFPSLTVAEHLRIGRWLGTALGDVEELLERMFPRLAERAGQRAGSLSGGEQLMLGIARALLARPALLMIDELSANLSPAMREGVAELMGVLKEQGLGMLLVEQDAEFALSLADRALFLERGAVVFDGPPRELAGRTDLLRPVFLARASAAH